MKHSLLTGGVFLLSLGALVACGDNPVASSSTPISSEDSSSEISSVVSSSSEEESSSEVTSEVTSESSSVTYEWFAEINGTKAGIESEDPGDDVAKFTITLAVDDVLGIYHEDTALHFYHWDAEAEEAVDDGATFTATLAGDHIVYVNAYNELWVTPPTPASNWQLEINGVKESATSEEVDPTKDLGKFVVALSVDDVLKVYYDDEALHFYHWEEGTGAVDDGDSFTATKEGNHTLYINLSGEIWITEPVEADDWYIAGEGSLWEADDWAKTDAVKMESSDTDLAKLEGVTLAVGDKFKLTDFGDNWLGINSVNSSTLTVTDYFGGTDNIEVVAAGTFNFYLNTSYEIWVTLAA